MNSFTILILCLMLCSFTTVCVNFDFIFCLSRLRLSESELIFHKFLKMIRLVSSDLTSPIFFPFSPSLPSFNKLFVRTYSFLHIFVSLFHASPSILFCCYFLDALFCFVFFSVNIILTVSYLILNWITEF